MYPTPAQTEGAAVGQELTQTSAQITRRIVNAPPTISVPARYKFTMRVSRDILFEAPTARGRLTDSYRRATRPKNRLGRCTWLRTPPWNNFWSVCFGFQISIF